MTLEIYRAGGKTPDEDVDITSKRGYPPIYFDRDNNGWYADIETMDDLKHLSDLYHEDIIFERPLRSIRKNYQICVYDDYVE